MVQETTTTKATAVRTNLFVNPELWRALRMQALEERTTATDLLNRIIAVYIATEKRRKKQPLTETEKAMMRAEGLRTRAVRLLSAKGA